MKIIKHAAKVIKCKEMLKILLKKAINFPKDGKKCRLICNDFGGNMCYCLKSMSFNIRMFFCVLRNKRFS